MRNALERHIVRYISIDMMIMFLTENKLMISIYLDLKTIQHCNGAQAYQFVISIQGLSFLFSLEQFIEQKRLL